MSAIEARDIVKSFGNAPVLKGVSLAASEGDVISIIGASGSGKSTFLRCLNLLEVPDSGEIIVGHERLQIHPGKDRAGHDPDRRQVERIRRNVAMVFQSFNLWHHMTVLGNVIEAPIHVHGRTRADAIEEARILLAKVGLTHRADAYPSQLSGGEQQRAAIARALATHPRVILFDEPTSALDPQLVGEVLSVIRDLANEGRTMIIVTHEMAFARDVSSRTIFLNEGRIEEEGSSAMFFSAPKSPRLCQFLEAFRSGGFTLERTRARVPPKFSRSVNEIRSMITNACTGRVFAALFFAILACVSAQAQQQKLRIATEGANPPFSTIDSSGKVEGFDVDIAHALCAKMGVECEIVAQDWDGIIPALLSKKYDAVVASMSVTDDRKKVVAFTKPYYRSPSVFIAHKGTSAKDLSAKALAGKSIGVQSGAVQSSYLEDRYNRSNVRLYNTIADAYRDLAAGRVEFVFYDKLAVYDWLKSQEGSCCEIVGNEFDEPAYFGSGIAIALRKGDDALAQRLNSAIDGIVADGAYAKINAKYFPFSIY